MIHNTPQEHRPTVSNRRMAERELESLGWTLVNLPRTQPHTQFIDMMKWCEDYVGQGHVEVEQGKVDANDQWYSFSWYGYWNFWFRNEQDATAFTLRWA